jgi:hypothetical protein
MVAHIIQWTAHAYAKEAAEAELAVLAQQHAIQHNQPLIAILLVV